MTAPSAQKPVTPERLMGFAFGYAAPLMIEAGVRNRLFDALAGGAKSAPELSRATGADERGIRILANGLIGLDLLARDAHGKYVLTPEAAEFLVSAKPGFRGGFFKHTSVQMLPRWLQLSEIVRTGKPASAVNQEGPGAQFFEEFVEDLFPMNYRAAQMLGEALSIPKAAQPVSVLDLAAGSGVWSIPLAQQSPQVRVTAVDWPTVIQVTQRVAQRHGVADRYRFVAGDLHDADFGTGHHVATLGHILHSEGAERSQALLRKTFAALAPGGVIAVAEWLVNEDRTGPPPGLMFAVNMLVNTDAGDTFSFQEIARWLQSAGFANARLLDVPSISPLVLANKPQ